MKKLTLLLILSMLPLLAFAQTDSSMNALPPISPTTTSARQPGLETDEGTTRPLVTNGCVSLTPDSRDYGMQPVDFPTASRLFTLTNNCAVDLTVTNVNAEGQSFSQTNGCGILIPPHSCDIHVVFDPISAGAKSQDLVITYLKQGNPNPMQISAGLTGTGIHDLTFSPTSCDFITYIVNGQGSTGYCTVTVQNQEPERITLDRCAVSPAPPFSQDTGCPLSLASNGNPNDSVNIQLDFQTDQAGTYMGRFAVTTNSPEELQSGNPYTVPLLGDAHYICPPPCCEGSGVICPPPSDLGINTDPSNPEAPTD